MTNEIRGSLIPSGIITRVDNAFVEDTACFDNSSGWILISYSSPGANNVASVQNIRLNLNRNTVILNSFGQNMCTCCIQRGMWVNAIFSSRMTRSFPPQANAFLIIAQRNRQPESLVTTDRIASIDTRNNFVYTGNPDDINRQIRFVVSDRTTITDRIGRPIRLNALRPGQLVRITHANFQTASIPPQTTAFQIQII